jgi:REP element-mobilizing transposase RayT
MKRQNEERHAQNVHETEDHVQNAHVTGMQNAHVTDLGRVTPYSFFYTREDFERIEQRKGAYLPHWKAANAVYHVSFRLHDSIPKSVSERLAAERDAMLAALRDGSKPFTKFEREQVLYLYSEKIDRHLDKSYGSCWLKIGEIAELVANALGYFDGDRYDLLAWCVMPNHVHAVVHPIGKYTISNLMHSWKSFTARKANKILNREGKFWMQEYFDRIMRNPEELMKNMDYVYMNPDSAGFKNWKWKGRKDISELI